MLDRCDENSTRSHLDLIFFPDKDWTKERRAAQMSAARVGDALMPDLSSLLP
jgi:hypothetical protein